MSHSPHAAPGRWRRHGVRIALACVLVFVAAAAGATGSAGRSVISW